METTLSFLQILILAAIQGFAELLPVSSSAHVIVAQRLMGLNPSSPPMTFLLIMLHTGTMFAVIFFFWKRWRQILLPSSATAEALALRNAFAQRVVVATAVTGGVGLLLKQFIEKVFLSHHEHAEIELLFGNLNMVGAALASAGVLIIVSGRMKFKMDRAQEHVPSLRSSAVIGFVQGLCLPFRGFSRAGATISTAMFCGVSKETAESFSFVLAVVLTPPVIVRGIWRLLKHSGDQGETLAGLTQLIAPGAVGMVLSFLTGVIALRILSRWLEAGRWSWFGYYCLTFAAATVVLGNVLQ